MLSKTKYGLLCVVGTKIFYVLCIIYGVLLSGKAMELHHGLFELIPGFVWGNPVSMVWGAVYMGVLGWIAVGTSHGCITLASL
jgi:hypothetical protein